MAIRTNTNPREMDLQPEMQKILMRNGMQAHVVSDSSGTDWSCRDMTHLC